MSDVFLNCCPFSLEIITQAVQVLERAGVARDDVEYILTILGDSVVGTGSGQKQFRAAVKLFAEVYYRGFLTSSDVNNFRTRGSIQAHGVLVEKFGLSLDEYTRKIKMGVPSEQALPLLLEGLEARYQGSMSSYVQDIIERHSSQNSVTCGERHNQTNKATTYGRDNIMNAEQYVIDIPFRVNGSNLKVTSYSLSESYETSVSRSLDGVQEYHTECVVLGITGLWGREITSLETSYSSPAGARVKVESEKLPESLLGIEWEVVTHEVRGNMNFIRLEHRFNSLFPNPLKNNGLSD